MLISQSLPYYDVFPNSKGKKSTSTRTVTIVKLRHPEKSIDNIFEHIENEQDKNEENACKKMLGANLGTQMNLINNIFRR